MAMQRHGMASRCYGRARQSKTWLGKATAMYSKARQRHRWLGNAVARFGRVCTAAATQADAIRGLAPHGKGMALLGGAEQ